MFLEISKKSSATVADTITTGIASAKAHLRDLEVLNSFMRFLLFRFLFNPRSVTYNKLSYFIMNVIEVGHRPACKDKHECSLLTTGTQGCIMNMFMKSVGLSHKPFDSIAIMGTLKVPLPNCKQSLRRNFFIKRAMQMKQYDSRCFYGYTLVIKFFNELFSAQLFFFWKGVPNLYFMR